MQFRREHDSARGTERGKQEAEWWWAPSQAPPSMRTEMPPCKVLPWRSVSTSYTQMGSQRGDFNKDFAEQLSGICSMCPVVSLQSLVENALSVQSCVLEHVAAWQKGRFLNGSLEDVSGPDVGYIWGPSHQFRKTTLKSEICFHLKLAQQC